MSYPIEIRLANKKGWHTPSEARAYYGRYDRMGVTVHWWGLPSENPDSAHNKIVNYILGKANAGTGSVNYVLSNTKITMLVNPDNVAWASQAGNPTTVSVEFSPHLNDEGYKKAGWLINELFNPANGRYRRAPVLYPHKHWVATACPGTLDLNRMKAEANKWATGGYNPAPTPAPSPPPTPAPAPTPPSTAVIEWVQLPESTKYVFNKNAKLWKFDVTNWNSFSSVKDFKQGEEIDIYGMGINKTLNATYLLVKDSFDKKIPNGFNRVDLDLKPRPVPSPPPEPSVPAPIPPPPLPPTESDLSWIKRALEAILRALNIKV